MQAFVQTTGNINAPLYNEKLSILRKPIPNCMENVYNVKLNIVSIANWGNVLMEWQT